MRERAFCFVDFYVISKRRRDVFPKIRLIKHFGRARVKTLSLSLCVSISFSANVSNREWILGSVGITSNHVFSIFKSWKFMDIIAWYNCNERRASRGRFSRGLVFFFDSVLRIFNARKPLVHIREGRPNSDNRILQYYF